MQTLEWNSPLSKLYKKASVTTKLLHEAGIHHLYDLLWIFPNSIETIPPVRPFQSGKIDQIFKGQGKVISISKKPSLWAKGKKGVKLFNLSVMVKDLNGSQVITLKWFNTYPSVIKTLEEHEFITFYGELSLYGSTIQIISPHFQALDLSEDHEHFETRITYPAINTVKSATVGMLYHKIPNELWSNIPEYLPRGIQEKRKLTPLQECFQIMHGKVEHYEEKKDAAILTLAYHEFFREQVKILTRRKIIKKPKADSLSISEKYFQHLLTLFPYELTEGQKKSLFEIRNDLSASHPMMRLLQGDVGSGKTTVALISILIALKSGQQAALMCPTEALALQHSLTFQSILHTEGFSYQLLISSTKNSEKKLIIENLKNKKIDLIIGTHSLIQENIEFNKLGLAVIDEQHKFGVEQRIKLLKKGVGVHCLIMTATPIPRSLSLTQFGDLDISIINEFPKSKKQIKTKIVTNLNFQKFLSFLKTRLLMKEQAYVVVPAIEENPEMDIMNLEEVFAKFKKIFPEFKVASLHGKMKAQEKEEVVKKYFSQQVDLLISTSVVEVGIDVPNATIMAILNPERFGLSSLHQLRGRVGRGQKPGFCFLVLDKQISGDSLSRLTIIEKNTDGFIIAEEDLKIRGEGDLFGKDQSGKGQLRRVASLLTHADILQQARTDVELLMQENTPWIQKEIGLALKDSFVTQTI